MSEQGTRWQFVGRTGLIDPSGRKYRVEREVSEALEDLQEEAQRLRAEAAASESARQAESTRADLLSEGVRYLLAAPKARKAWPEPGGSVVARAVTALTPTPTVEPVSDA